MVLSTVFMRPGGTGEPPALAVLMLRMMFIFPAASTGIDAGFAPLNILSAFSPAARPISCPE